MSSIVDSSTYLQELVAEFKKEWPGNRTINIVCHGHSVPSGYFKTPLVDTFNAYPHLLHRGLKEQFPHAVINVIVTAIGGESSPSGAARFDQDVLTHRPELITFDYALNDRGIGLEAARKAWEEIIRKALNQKIKVLLLTPTGDLAADLDNPQDPLNQHAEQIRKLACQFGVGLVDSLRATHDFIKKGTPLEDLMSQGNHPNRRGHDLVAAELLEWFPAT